MSDIDDKLRAIGVTPPGFIAQIKQAFADEGYIKAATLPKGIYNATGNSLVQLSGDGDLSRAYLKDFDEQGAKSIKIDGNTYYRGQEWYDRFRAELEREYGVPIMPIEEVSMSDRGNFSDVLEAAKRAAGLENQNTKTEQDNCHAAQ